MTTAQERSVCRRLAVLTGEPGDVYGAALSIDQLVEQDDAYPLIEYFNLPRAFVISLRGMDREQTIAALDTRLDEMGVTNDLIGLKELASGDAESIAVLWKDYFQALRADIMQAKP